MDYSNYLKSFCQEVLRPIIVDAVKEAVPKELQKKDKQYYTRKQVCEMLTFQLLPSTVMLIRAS